MHGGLCTLPTEIILHVANCLDYEYEINALSRVNRQFHQLLNAELYKANVRNGRGYGDALLWVAVHGVESTLAEVLAAGSRLDSVLLPVAAAYGQSTIVKRLCEHRHCKEVDLDRHTSLGEQVAASVNVDLQLNGTPLTLAAQYGHESVVRLLLKYGADIESGGVEGRTALSLAAELGYLSIVKALVRHGANIETFDITQATPLHLASRAGNTEIVRFLLENHADVYHQDERRYSALAVAAAGGHTETVKYLLGYGARHSMQMLTACARYQRVKVLKLLVRHFDYPRSAQNQAELTTVASAASACGLSDLLNEVIAQDWEVNSVPVRGYFEYDEGGDEYWTPLAYAASFGHLDIVRLLLSHGANVNGMRYRAYELSNSPVSPLSRAVRGGWADIVTVLLDRGAIIPFADSDGGRDGVLYHAAPYGLILKTLLERGALECTPRHFDQELLVAEAVRGGNANAVQILIDKREYIWRDGFILEDFRRSSEILAEADGPVLDVLVQADCLPKTGGRAEIATACSSVRAGNITVLQHLISRGLEISPRCPDLCFELLHKVVTITDMEVAKISLDFLLGEGLDINTVDNDGQNILLSILHKQTTLFTDDSIEVLVGRGANPCFEDAQGNCPLLAAVHYEDTWSGTVIPLLRGIDAQNIAFKVFEPQLLRAISAAEEHGHRDGVLRSLRRFYWRRRYPVDISFD